MLVGVRLWPQRQCSQMRSRGCVRVSETVFSHPSRSDLFSDLSLVSCFPVQKYPFAVSSFRELSFSDSSFSEFHFSLFSFTDMPFSQFVFFLRMVHFQYLFSERSFSISSVPKCVLFSNISFSKLFVQISPF